MSYPRLVNTTDTVCSHPDLDNLVGPRGEQISSGGLIVHVNNAVLAVMEGGRGSSTRRHKGNAGYFTVRALQKAESTKVQYMATTEADCYSLLVSDGLVAAVTHTHLKLKAHEGDGGAFGRTLATHGLATLPTVVLRNTVGLQHVSSV